MQCSGRVRGRDCCAESARSGQDRSLHGTRERRIVGRGLDPSAGFALPHTPTGGYGIRPYGAGVDAPHRPGKLFPISVGAGYARRRGRGCCAESARSGQDRSLHGTRERRIVGRCGVVSVGPRLSVAKPGSEQCLPLRGKQPHERASFAGWRRSLCAAKRS